MVGIFFTIWATKEAPENTTTRQGTDVVIIRPDISNKLKKKYIWYTKKGEKIESYEILN